VKLCVLLVRGKKLTLTGNSSAPYPKEVKWQAPSSKAKLQACLLQVKTSVSRMSPVKGTMTKRSLGSTRITEVTLDDDQHDDLCEIVKKI